MKVEFYMMTWFRAVMSCAIVIGLAANMAGQASATVDDSSVPKAQALVQAPDGPQLKERAPRYAIQKQDVVLISFPLSPEFNQAVTVQPDGFINLQNGTSIHVQGLTVPDMAKEVGRAYAGVLHNPIVNIDLEDFQKPFFSVTGQVGKPGQYELRNEITVSEALAVAGGLQATGKTQVFLFRRTPNSMYQVEKIDMKRMYSGKSGREDPTIQPGDMVYVPEKFITNFRKYVPYTVNAGWYMSGIQ
jgi:polysaccharide biosynthesis/export protein